MEQLPSFEFRNKKQLVRIKNYQIQLCLIFGELNLTGILCNLQKRFTFGMWKLMKLVLNFDYQHLCVLKVQISTFICMYKLLFAPYVVSSLQAEMLIWSIILLLKLVLKQSNKEINRLISLGQDF
eukprot:TRINITY_DN19217_c0_g4_i1.p5 TRINITY_DN19217_c0_g4~~TRINITY_DN19217_c0_g4_i1.p5  ORF type:complete len:125 (-),score=0.83 TRINITY_DN19217_c0_g4_i1:725-1099(-)